MLNVGQKQQFFKEYELFGIFKRGTSFKYNILSGISFFSPAVCSMLRAKHQYELSAIFRGTTPSNRKVFASLPLPNRTLLILPCIQPCFILDIEWNLLESGSGLSETLSDLSEASPNILVTGLDLPEASFSPSNAVLCHLKAVSGL